MIDVRNGGYLLYPISDENKKFNFNKHTSSNSIDSQEMFNTNKKVLTTFGKYPFAYRVGNSNYRTFDLVTTFIAIYNDDGSRVGVIDQVNDFKDALEKESTFVVETPLNERLKCFVELKSIDFPYGFNEKNYEFATVNISCTEIGSV